MKVSNEDALVMMTDGMTIGAANERRKTRLIMRLYAELNSSMEHYNTDMPFIDVLRRLEGHHQVVCDIADKQLGDAIHRGKENGTIG